MQIQILKSILIKNDKKEKKKSNLKTKLSFIKNLNIPIYLQSEVLSLEYLINRNSKSEIPYIYNICIGL